MRLDALPKRLVILGGGYIASEFAAVFSALGSEVVQVNRSGALMRQLDADISAAFTEAAAERWDVELDADAAGASTEHGEALNLRLRARRQASGPGGRRRAGGHRPHAQHRLAGRGRARLSRCALTARWSLTSTSGCWPPATPWPGLFGLGDAANTEQLKHVANREARVVVHNLENPRPCGPWTAASCRRRCSATRRSPTSVPPRPRPGPSTATEAVLSVIQPYGSTAYGWAMEDTEGIVKLLAHKDTGLLLGAHIMGHEASLLIQPLIQAMATAWT